MTENNLLKEERKKKGLTQIDLANLSGISVQWIAMIEQGLTSGASLNTKRQLANVLSVNLYDIFPCQEIPIEQFHLMKNSYGRLCLGHGGILLGKLGNMELFEGVGFHPVYDDKNNIIAIKREDE